VRQREEKKEESRAKGLVRIEGENSCYGSILKSLDEEVEEGDCKTGFLPSHLSESRQCRRVRICIEQLVSLEKLNHSTSPCSRLSLEPR
jgi:hypothetical protein